MKSLGDQMDIVHAYQTVGTYRGAAALCGTTHKTVKRVIERQAKGQVGRQPGRVPKAAKVAALIAQRVKQTDGRITAKRLLPMAEAAGYEGSTRTFERAVREAKGSWKQRRRGYRPWVPTPGQHLVVDWASEGGWQCFCAVLAWSHVRFVRFANDQRRETTLRLMDECFAECGGVPAIVLSDRMACLRAGIVANVVVPHPEYVAFATQYGFHPDFCEAADPESKGIVEALAGYVQRDLIVPAIMNGGWADVAQANVAARAWCAEVNAREHREIAAVPAERLIVERSLLRPMPSLRPPLRRSEWRKVDRLGMVRYGSGRYAVSQELVGMVVEVRAEDGAVIIHHRGAEVARHAPVAPGEVAFGDFAKADRPPARGVRPRTSTEVAFLALGTTAETFLRAAAAAGTMRLEAELAQIVAMEAAWGRAALLPALERATRFRRFKAADVRSILGSGRGLPMPTASGAQLSLALPPVPERDLGAYALPATGATR